MINWDLLKAACEERISIYKSALKTGKGARVIEVQRKYNRVIARYQRLLFFIDQRTSIGKPKQHNYERTSIIN